MAQPIHPRAINAYASAARRPGAPRATRPAATPQQSPTRADIDPPRLEIRALSRELGLSESQRNQVRPILALEDRKSSLIQHAPWSIPAKRRAALWETRDDTIKAIKRVLDPKQAEKLAPLLGPAK
jgi:hypothetical protein